MVYPGCNRTTLDTSAVRHGSRVIMLFAMTAGTGGRSGQFVILATTDGFDFAALSNKVSTFFTSASIRLVMFSLLSNNTSALLVNPDLKPTPVSAVTLKLKLKAIRVHLK